MKTLLEEAIDSWQDARNGVINEVENLPAGRFDFRPAPAVRNIEALVIHIMEVSLMMAGELTREDTNLHRYPWLRLLAHYSKPIENVTGKRKLLSALRSTLRDGVKEFRRAGDIHMMQQIVRFDGNKGTRLQWFHHGIAHEEYHRGQLALYARLLDLTPALTQLIQGSS
ncbi:MAG TPA: DinB family protein [Thermoanaerobaculia bacterium]